MAHGVLKRQIKEGLSRLVNLESCIMNPLYVAYEPLWAISSNKKSELCSPETAISRIVFIKEQLLHLAYDVSVRYLYGGSVTSKNAAHFLNKKDIDGLLIGAASSNPSELKKIWHLALKL